MESIRDWTSGLIRLNVWSFAVPAAIVSGYWFALRRARQAGLATREFESSLEWCVGGGLVLSHMVEILLYQPHRLKAEGPLTLLKFWDGLSSYGGFFGAVVVLTIFYRVLRKRRWWREADCIMQGLILGWIFGRFGCTMSGDHPGPRTTVPWAFHYPDGPRHNMGLYEMVFTIVVLFPANLILYRLKPPTGSFIAMNCLMYGAGRFALDFLRATDRTDSDPRYLGLTLGHYCSLGIFLFGLVVAVLARGNHLAPPTVTIPATQER
jgi:phosphatidylglycerol---prolipoprotein diacylglyceryl transferase